MIKNYIFLGVPGIGKGTLASKLSFHKGLIHISTGEIFRKEIKQKTTLGMKIKHLVELGKYVPDAITNPIVKKNLLLKNVQKHGFILDGYPRTINQAQFLKDNNFKIHNVICLDANEEVVLSRLLSRSGARKDDALKIIKKRFAIYNKHTKPLINWYKNENILSHIDVSGTITKNYELLIKAIHYDLH